MSQIFHNFIVNALHLEVSIQLYICCLCVCVCLCVYMCIAVRVYAYVLVCVYSRLALGCVLRNGDGKGRVGELRRPWSRYHGDNCGGTTAAQPIRRHHSQEILPVPLQRKSCGPHLAVLPVHLKATVATWRSGGTDDIDQFILISQIIC